MRPLEIVLAFIDIKGHKTCIAGQGAPAGAHKHEMERVTFGVLPPYTPERLPPKGASNLGLPPSVSVDMGRIERAHLFPILRSGMTLRQWQQTPETGIAEMMHEVSSRRPFFAAPCNELLLFSIAFRLAESGLMMPNLFSVTLFPDKEDFTPEADREVDQLIEASTTQVLASVARIKSLVRTCPA